MQRIFPYRSLGVAALLYSFSLTAHAQFTPSPATFLSHVIPDDFCQEVVTDGAGNWVMVWHTTNFFGPNLSNNRLLVSRSTDNGATWTTPADLKTNAATDDGFDGAPDLATDGVGNWIAVWGSADTLGGTIGADGDILVSRSTNNGVTWTPPVALNSNAATDSNVNDSSPEIATDDAGNWVVVWWLSSAQNKSLMVSRSTNNGETWTAAATIHSAWDGVFEGPPSVVTDGSGNWLAACPSKDSLGGTIGTDSDILVSRSTNNGVTWTAPAALNTTAATDDRADYSSSVITDNNGNWLAVWVSDKPGTGHDIVASRSINNGITWSTPTPINPDAAADTVSHDDPHVATDGAGNWIAVWSSDYDPDVFDIDTDILGALSTDNGVSWSQPITINSTAISDNSQFYADSNPHVTTDGAGNWVTVWDSDNDLGGPDTSYYDSFVTRWFLPVGNSNNIYVDFNAFANGVGTPGSPFNNLTDAVGVANDDATIYIAPSTSDETFTGISALGSGNHPMTLVRSGASGFVRIGAP